MNSDHGLAIRSFQDSGPAAAYSVTGRRSAARQWLLGPLAGTVACNIGLSAAGLLSGVVLARYLGPDARGELAAAILWPNLLLIVGDLGLGFAFAYYIAKEPGASGKCSTLALTAGLSVGTLLCLIGLFLLRYAASLTPATIAALRVTMPSIPAMITTGYLNYLLLGSGHIAAYNTIRIVGGIAYPFSVLTLASFHKLSVSSGAWAFLVSQAVGIGVALFVALRFFKFAPEIDPKLTARVFSYGVMAYLSSIAGQTSLRLDQMLMTIFLSPAELGRYVVASAIGSGFGPWFSALAVLVLQRTARVEGRGAAAVAMRQTRFGACVAVPLAALLCPLLPWLVPRVFGPAFRGAVLPAQVLLAATIFQGLNAVLGNALLGLGRPKSSMIAQVAGLAAVALFLAALLRTLGGLGAAISAVAASAIVFGLQMWMLRRVSNDLDCRPVALEPIAQPVGAAK